MLNMGDAELNTQYKNFHELSEFQLAVDDAYDTRCGEVYITLNRVLVFHCSLCDKKYGCFDYFLEHLSAMHYEDIQEEVVDIGTEGSDNYSYDELSQEQDDDRFKDEVKLNIEQFGEEYMEEVEGFHSEKTGGVEIEEQTSFDTSTNYEMEFQQNSKVYKCNECDKRFESRRKFNKHSTTHSTERNHKCKICGFAFKERSNLNAHLRRHTGQKRASCQMCPKKFFTHSEAEAHQRIHTGERPVLCTYCGRAFRTSGALNEHVKRHNNIRPHKCLHCDKRFYDSGQLRDHMAVHTNERPFVCDVCSASFALRKSLRVHTKIHINAKEYECNLCGKSFNQSPALFAHMKTHKVVDSK